MRRRLLSWTSHSRFAWLVALLGLALTLPALSLGFLLDDFHHLNILRGHRFPGGPRGVWDLYRFADGGEGSRQAIEQGIFPWWSNPDLKLAFLRPLSSLWRAADHALLGESSTWIHLQGCLLYGVLVLVALRVYGRLVGTAAGGVAGLMFAVDDAHGQAASWIANRYSLLCALLSLLTFLCHVRRAKGESPAWIGPLVFVLALGAGEASLGALGYLVGFAWFLEPRGRRVGLLAITPYLGITLVWALVYKTLGYGAAGSGFYVDPGGSPLLFVGKVVERLPLLLLGQMFVPPPELLAAAPAAARLPIAFVATLIVGAVALGIARAARGQAAALALATGTLLSAIPTCAAVPDDRLLMLPGFGFFGVLGIAFAGVWSGGVHVGRVTRGVLSLLAVLHLVLAPVLLPVRAVVFARLLGGFASAGAATLTLEQGSARPVVVVGGPDALFVNYMVLEKLLGLPQPALNARILTEQDGGTMTVLRTGQSSLTVTNERGMMNGPFAAVTRDHGFTVGEVSVVGGHRMEVLAVSASGHPTRIAFDLGAPLESMRLLVFEGRRFVELEAPPTGRELHFQMLPFMEAIN